MNPLGGLTALLGVVLILIGISGTQRNVAQALRGARPTGSGGTSPAAGGGSSSGPYDKGSQAAGGVLGFAQGVAPAPVQPPVVAPPVHTGGGLTA